MIEFYYHVYDLVEILSLYAGKKNHVHMYLSSYLIFLEKAKKPSFTCTLCYCIWALAYPILLLQTHLSVLVILYVCMCVYIRMCMCVYMFISF